MIVHEPLIQLHVYAKKTFVKKPQKKKNNNKFHKLRTCIWGDSE